MSNKVVIETIADVLKLTSDQFERFVPDFIAYYKVSKKYESLGAVITPVMRWIDDGYVGVSELTISVDITNAP